jgi:hypothetical protein
MTEYFMRECYALYESSLMVCDIRRKVDIAYLEEDLRLLRILRATLSVIALIRHLDSSVTIELHAPYELSQFRYKRCYVGTVGERCKWRGRS